MNKLNLQMMTMILAVPAFILSSCTSEEDAPKPQPVSEGISFISQVKPMSKATETGFEIGDAISVFAVDPVQNSYGQLQESNYADNVRYVYSDNKFVSVESPIYYGADMSPLYFKAVYPYLSNAASVFNFNVSPDQRSYSNYTNSDLMLAETAATNEETPHLVFQHYLCNIIFNISFEGNRPSGETQLVVNDIPVTVKFDINSKEISTMEGTSNVYANENGTDSYKIIAVPTVIESGKNLITLTIGQQQYNWDLTQSLEWKSGKQYTYNLTINQYGEVSYTAEILPWGESQDIEEIVPPEILDDMEEYIPIHRGINPPNIEGTFYIDSNECVYCEDENDGGYNPGDIVMSQYIRFFNQNNKTLTIDYEEAQGNSSAVGYGSFISGEGDNFTVYFDTNGISHGIPIKTALVISGTKIEGGIRDLNYAFVMVEKGDDPERILMDEGVFRVFKDGDNFSESVDWGGLEYNKKPKVNINIPTVFSNAKMFVTK